MPQKPINPNSLYLDDPRLRMSIAGRVLVRSISYISYVVIFVATFTFLFSGIHFLVWTGLFLMLFMLDLLVHHGEGDTPFSELPVSGARVNLTSVTAPSAFSMIERTLDRSLITRKDFFLELARRLLESAAIVEGLRRLDVKPEDFKTKLESLFHEPPSPNAVPVAAPGAVAEIETLLVAAFAEALSAGHEFITPPDLFSALTKVNDDAMDRLFNLFSIAPGDLERALIFGSFSKRGWFRRLPHALGGFGIGARHEVKHRIMNRAWTARPTPLLDKYGIDFTDRARDAQVGFLIGHDAEYERLVETLARPIDPNALLIGEPGIGKEAIINHLALALVKDDVPKGLFDRRLVGLQLQNLVAGAPPEELEARLKTIVEEIFTAGNIILYIPDIHNLVRTSGTAYLSAADALMPVIMANNFPIVGSTYPREFHQLIEPRSDFAGIFDEIPVNEITEEEAEKVLTYESILLEEESDITISFGAIKRAVFLAKKYMRDKFLPASAEELLKSALVDAERRGEKALGPDQVTVVAEEKVNVPMHEAEGDEAEKLLHMEQLIHERLVDQEEAVKAVADAIREYRSGLTRKGGPIASFLFVGPTGVGKTELAKILAELQFGSQKMMIRFDMTEYQDKQSFYRFIGSPDGSVRGALTDAVLAKPYSLVLLDEFEKAFPDILNLFLQVLDDGRLTDNLSRTVDFTNTIIIATSNAHSDIINEALSKGETMADIADYVKARLTDVFKPELLNRFSRTIIFKNLAPDDLSKIVALNLQELVGMMKDRGIYLSFTPEALHEIAKLGYDPAFGARPLRRVIDEKVRAPLSEAILGKKVMKGNRVRLVYENDKFDFVSE
ncbi:MAG: ATP-dependent Clp protease ATP-binding subunit [Candidatus Pacebacteria bacterium]|nr:ATP-dependent Clp protease ATP-binding subunit [Candidatus Paceibacterota bacterium]